MDIREKTLALIEQALERDLATSPKQTVDGDNSPAQLAFTIEDCIFRQCGETTNNDYRSSVRAHLVALKSDRTFLNGSSLRQMLFDGVLDPCKFAAMSSIDMASIDQRQRDNNLLEQELKLKIIAPPPQSIKDIPQAGKELEKWSTGRSAAALDDDDY